MNYKKGDKVIINDKKILKEFQDGIKNEEDPKLRRSLQKELEKFKKYMKLQKENEKSFVIIDMMWESPEILCMYYLIGHWYMKETNIIGLAK